MAWGTIYYSNCHARVSSYYVGWREVTIRSCELSTNCMEVVSSWKKHVHGWLKMNTDVTIRKSHSRMSFGWVV